MARNRKTPRHTNRPTPPPPRDRRRAYSQNFLTDTATARRLIRTARIGPTDDVIEVGAGDGMLTRYLAPACGHLTAYEIDPRLAARLTARFGPGAHIRQTDFRNAPAPARPFHLIGNIPYAATADIVRWCLNAPHLTSATLLTQLEYARKRTGSFGRWSKLTVQTWPHMHWQMHGRIPRHHFDPIPRVDSAILRLTRRPRPLLPPHRLAAYRRLVDLGYTGRGGSLRASLRQTHPRNRVDAALAAARIPRTALVAHVSPDQWITLHTHLAPGR